MIDLKAFEKKCELGKRRCDEMCRSTNLNQIVRELWKILSNLRTGDTVFVLVSGVVEKATFLYVKESGLSYIDLVMVEIRGYYTGFALGSICFDQSGAVSAPKTQGMVFEIDFNS